MVTMTDTTPSLVPEDPAVPTDYPWIRAWAHISGIADPDPVAQRMIARALEEQAPETAIFRFLPEHPWSRLEDVMNADERWKYIEYGRMTGRPVPDEVLRAWLDPDHRPDGPSLSRH